MFAGVQGIRGLKRGQIEHPNVRFRYYELERVLDIDQFGQGN